MEVNHMYAYSCKETCGQEKHCGNRYCSAHPYYYGPKTKKSKTQKEGTTPFQRRRVRTYQSKSKY